MKAEKFSEALGNVRDDYINEANTYNRSSKSRSWIKWGAAAACLCLVAAGSGVLISRNFNKPVTGNENDITIDGGEKGGVTGGGDKGGVTGGGTATEPGGLTGGDSDDLMSGSYSVAVYPPSEKREDVASAKVDGLTEDEAFSNELAKHLPKQLPDGFHFGRGWIYNTVMKDGTTYNMLKIEYISGWIQEQKFTEDGGAIAPDVWTEGDSFYVCVKNYEPDTHDKYIPDPDKQPVSVIEEIYSSAEEVPISLLEQFRTVYIRCGENYVSVERNTAESEVVLEALRSIE